MLPTVDLVVMASFLVGVIAYVALIGRRGDGGVARNAPGLRKVGLRDPDRAVVGDRGETRGPQRASAAARLAPLAAALSLLAPGLGHFLIGARMRGLLWLGGWLILAAVSGALHSPIVFIWMVIAAIDAYVIGRSGNQASDNGESVEGD